jgi:hypothetical protein
LFMIRRAAQRIDGHHAAGRRRRRLCASGDPALS